MNGVIHLSEYAYWKNPEKQLNALSQAVSDTGKIIIESTANGFNKFSEVYYQAKNYENSYKSFFFNWVDGKELFKNQYQQATVEYTARNGHELSYEGLDADETELFDIGASLEQLAWRRKKISTDGKDAFNVEYPATDTDCFLTSGQQLFESKRIDNCIQTIIKDKVTYIPKNNIIGLPAILQDLYGKSLQIFSTPKIGGRYYIGVDCSEGIGHDYSTAIVLDKDGEQVAQFKNNQIKPYQLADIIDTLGRYYNKALLTIEKASGGHSVIERLRYDKCYMNMMKYKTYDEFNRAVWKVGLDTNNKTKSIIVNDGREWFERGLLKISSRDILEEMKVFVANDKGGMGAISGSHDDLVMALCLAIVGMKNGLWYPF